MLPFRSADFHFVKPFSPSATDGRRAGRKSRCAPIREARRLKMVRRASGRKEGSEEGQVASGGKKRAVLVEVFANNDARY